MIKKQLFLFFTGMARPADRSAAMAAGASEYLIKANDLDKLTTTVRRLLAESSTISKVYSQLEKCLTAYIEG